MLFALYLIGIFIALHTPLKVAYAVAAMSTSAYCFLSKKDRDAVKANLTVLFPEYDSKRLNRMTREIFINFGKYLIDFFRFSIIDKEYVDKYIKIEGIEHYDNALKRGKGVIFASAHLGNWELGGVVVGVLGYNLSVVVLPHRHKRVDDFFIKQREIKGLDVVPVGISVRRCFSALKKNHAIALVGDRDYFDGGIKMNFFGKPTIIPQGPAVFARRCGSPIIPVFMIRNDDDTFTFKFHKAIIAEKTQNEHRDLVNTTEKIVDVLEKTIKAYPNQWFVFRRFWEKIGWERSSL